MCVCDDDGIGVICIHHNYEYYMRNCIGIHDSNSFIGDHHQHQKSHISKYQFT